MAARYNDLPSIRRNEYDASDVAVTRVGNTMGTVGFFPSGPIRRPVYVSDPASFLQTFGYPTLGKYTSVSSQNAVSGTGGISKIPEVKIPDYGYGHYTVLNALAETSSVIVVRAFTSADTYATSANDFTATYTSGAFAATSAVSLSGTCPAQPYLVGDIFDSPTYLGSVENFASKNPNTKLLVTAVEPSIDGNNYAYTVDVFTTACDWAFKYDGYPKVDLSASCINGATSANYPIGSKVVKVSVYRKPMDKQWSDLYSTSDDKAAGVFRFAPIETYYGTFDRSVTYNGQSMFLETAINGVSPNVYVKVGNSASVPLYAGSDPKPSTSADSAGSYVYEGAMFKLGGGAYNWRNEATSATDSTQWDIFRNRKELTVDILINPSWDDGSKKATANVVADRIDSFAELQSNSPSEYSVDSIIAGETYGYVAPSYVGLTAGFSKVYDPYTSQNLYLPNSIFAGRADLRVLATGRPWNSVAGVSRGILPVDEQLKRYSDPELDRIIARNINPVSFERGYGFILQSARTAQLKSTALNRKNVRFTLLYIENVVEAFLKPFLFENNTPQTRIRIYTPIDEFLSGIKAASGIDAYAVICDESNNGPAVIGSNQLNVAIGIRPVMEIDFINMNVVVVKQGSDVNQVTISYGQ